MEVGSTGLSFNRAGVKREMLPQDRYEQACRLFCRILHRLEERDRNNVRQKDSTFNEGRENNNTIMEDGAINGVRVPSVPPRQLSRTKEKRLGRNAAG